MRHNVQSTEPVGPRRLCPKCQRPRVDRSRRQSVGEALQGWLGLDPFRCHACYHRFAARSETAGTVEWKDLWPVPRKRQAQRIARRIPVAGMSVALFPIFLNYLARPHFREDAP